MVNFLSLIISVLSLILGVFSLQNGMSFEVSAVGLLFILSVIVTIVCFRDFPKNRKEIYEIHQHGTHDISFGESFNNIPYLTFPKKYGRDFSIKILEVRKDGFKVHTNQFVGYKRDGVSKFKWVAKGK